MVDKPKVDQMLGNLRKYHGELEELGRIPREDFLADKHKIASAKYNFVIAIECCIDVANHVIASENYRFPRDNADSFAVLVGEGILAASMQDSLRNMARFRNRLVHLYWEVDDVLVHEYLRTRLSDLSAFAATIAQFLVTSEAVSGEEDEPPVTGSAR